MRSCQTLQKKWTELESNPAGWENHKKQTDNRDFQQTYLEGLEIKLGGMVGGLAHKVTRRWLMDIMETNPAILDMFRDAGKGRQRHLLAWSGEFAGKYLTGAVEIYRVTGDETLFGYLEEFVSQLLACQKANGYLGPFDEAHELTGDVEPAGYSFEAFTPERFDTWDSWGHYHIMFGLLQWYGLTGDEKAFQAVTKMARMFISRFYGPGQPRLVETKSEEMNLSVLHVFALLYQITGKKEYLFFAQNIMDDLAVPPAGNYLRLALQGVEFYQMPKPRWESLHPIEGMLEMYAATGEADYREAFQRLWWSMTATDLHNTGGFSTWEQAKGDPYQEGPIETCCTIAYMAVTADMLRLSGDSVAADILELSLFNGGIGSFSPSGRWSTYDTPMEGYKRANYQSIGFQCRPGGPDLNCCSVNAPRAIGLISKWACLKGADGSIKVNYYGEGELKIPLEGGTLRLAQKTQYPYDGEILIQVLEAPETLVSLQLRIPFWAEAPRVCVNKEEVAEIKESGYYCVSRVFHAGDTVRLSLGFCLKVWAGELRMAGKGSLFYGPLLLCADQHYDDSLDVEHLPCLDPKTAMVEAVCKGEAPGALFKLKWKDGSAALCDLYSAGVSGSAYTTWFPMENLEPLPFSKSNPFRLKRY